MEGERDKAGDETEGVGSAPPRSMGTRGTEFGHPPSEREKSSGQQGQSGTGQADLGSQAGSTLAGRTDQEDLGPLGGEVDQPGSQAAGQAATLNEGSEPDLGADDQVGPGGYSPESGASDLGGGETGLGDVGGFVGTEKEDSGDYLQRSGNPDEGFAEQGRGAPDQGDVERGTERTANRDSDIEGSSTQR